MNPSIIVVHHSLTKDSQTVSIGPIRDYHTKVNGWTDIGYHFIIENMRGHIEIVCGRMPDRQGAHCKGYNKRSIGICFVGNFDSISPSNKIWNAGIKLVKFLMRQYNIKNIVGHHELNPSKSCPGKYFDMDKFRKDCNFI